jgi:putative ABC transport system permease protein
VVTRVLPALDRKLLRDLWRLRGQAIAISAVMAAGVAMLLAYISTFESLQLTQRTYYGRYRFADVFASLKRAPLSLRSRIEEIPGVSLVETRVVADVTLDIAGMDEPAIGRLVSVPAPRRAILNDLFLRRGRFLDPGRPDEVLVNEGFALAHSLVPGSTLNAIINGRRRTLRVVGIALSPEYVYTIRPGEIIPDDERFGVLWMERQALGAAFNMEGGFNDLAVALMPGANEHAVIAAIDRVLRPYGGFGAIPQRLQVSNWALTNELTQLRGFGLMVPVIFLGISAFLLNVVLTRIVSVQREQIAALKALGYSNAQLGMHYVKWSLGVGVAGAGVGVVGGAWMGSGMTGMYNDFFRFPVLLYRLSPAVVVAATVVTLGAAVLGALGAVRRAVRLPPAEAMRPEPPARHRASVLERAGLGALLAPAARMVVRNIERQPVRAITSVVGIALASSMLVLGLFFVDAMDEMMRVQFDVIQRQDVTVTFVEPRSSAALFELQRLPGVMSVEPVRNLPVRLRAGHRSRQIAISGLVAAPRLQRVVTTSGDAVDLPPGGAVLSRTLAEILEVDVGSALWIEVLEGRRPVKQVPIVGLVDEYLGLSAYMAIDALHDLAMEAGVLSGGFLLVDSREEQALYQRLKLIPAVAGVALKQAAVASFNETLGETMGVMIFFNVLFAGTIAFGVVYNAARVSLSERSRELASLRVLGFTRGEISAILLGELAVVTVVAIPLGLATGYLLAAMIVSAFETEMYRFPIVVGPRTYAFAAVVTVTAAAISGLIVRRQLDRLNLVEVLKTRE